ncbi:MAG TPA: M50 family metallopeptidase [Verrucomicrobiae bacterium]|nr:M50 family metallopeptidase [Verrucomicrobiae bacterium]
MLLAALTLAGAGKILTFIATLSVLIILHEFGHFIVARRNGVRVIEFSLGMGPLIYSWKSKRSGTLYSVRALLIGGYCQMQGEDGKTSEAEQQRDFQTTAAHDDDNFQAKSPWRRLAIVLAGPFANFVLCYLILLVAALAFGVQGDGARPLIGMLVAGSPAEHAGLEVGDRIVAIDGKAIANGKDLIARIHGSLGKRLHLVYSRGGEEHAVDVTPGPCPPEVGPKLGCIGFQPVPTYQRVGVGEAFVDSGYGFVNIADSTLDSFVLLITHFSKYSSQTMGPIGMGQAAVTIQDWGWGPYLGLAALISFALGLFNLLPIPALDGGRAAFIVAELIRGKPVDPEKEAMVHIAGFAAIMALMLLVAFHDIARIAAGKGLM